VLENVRKECYKLMSKTFNSGYLSTCKIHAILTRA